MRQALQAKAAVVPWTKHSALVNMKRSSEKLPPATTPVSEPEILASFCPSDEELQAELQKLRKLQPSMGAQLLRNMLKEKHKHWCLSGNRVREMLSGATNANAKSKYAGAKCDSSVCGPDGRCRHGFVHHPGGGHQWYGAHLFPKDVHPAEFFEWLSKKASEGDAGAQYDIYVAYYNGIPGVVRVNQKLGDEWLEKAAMNPNAPAEALADYGYNLLVGTQHIQQDLPRAVQIFERSVRLGDSLGTFHLAHMLNDGTGVPSKQPERALQLWKLVADDKRDPFSSPTPGARPLVEIFRKEIPEAMYEYGRRCQDEGDKRRYLTLAAKQNLAKAQYELFTFLLLGPVEAPVSQEIQRTAAKWYRAAKRQKFVEPTPVIVDKVEDLSVEVVLLASVLKGGIETRPLHLRKERAKQLAESSELSEFEGDDGE